MSDIEPYVGYRTLGRIHNLSWIQNLVYTYEYIAFCIILYTSIFFSFITLFLSYLYIYLPVIKARGVARIFRVEGSPNQGGGRNPQYCRQPCFFEFKYLTFITSYIMFTFSLSLSRFFFPGPPTPVLKKCVC